MEKLTTKDGYEIHYWVFNSRDYSCHILICERPNEPLTSANSEVFLLNGRDEYECFINDAPEMNKSEIIKMFF